MISTYVFDANEFESAYGLCVLNSFYLLHFFDEGEYVGAIKYDGSFTRASVVKHTELETRYWTLFE